MALGQRPTRCILRCPSHPVAPSSTSNRVETVCNIVLISGDRSGGPVPCLSLASVFGLSDLVLLCLRRACFALALYLDISQRLDLPWTSFPDPLTATAPLSTTTVPHLLCKTIGCAWSTDRPARRFYHRRHYSCQAISSNLSRIKSYFAGHNLRQRTAHSSPARAYDDAKRILITCQRSLNNTGRTRQTKQCHCFFRIPSATTCRTLDRSEHPWRRVTKVVNRGVAPAIERVGQFDCGGLRSIGAHHLH